MQTQATATIQNSSTRLLAAKQVAAIFCIRAVSSIAYAVFYSGLTIFLTQNKHYAHESSTLITGIFLSFNYLLPLLGGFMTNHLISHKKLYIFGNIFRLLGCFLLLSQHYLHLALALFLIGSISNVSLSMFLTRLFTKEQKSDRKIAFTWNYIGMNIGFMVGYLLTGFSTLGNHYKFLFLLISIAVFTAILIAYFLINEEKPESNIYNVVACGILIVALTAGIKFIFDNAIDIHMYVTLMSCSLMLCIMLYAAKMSKNNERKSVYTYVIYSCLSMLFWTAYMLTPVAIMQLIHSIGQKSWMGFEWAPQWLVNIDSIIIISISPLVAQSIKRSGDDGYLAKTHNIYMLTFLLTSLAFFTLFAGFTHLTSNGKIPIFVFLGYLICITLAEILIYPTSSALVGELIPERLRNLMTGTWSVNLAIGSLLASFIASKNILPYLNHDYSLVEHNHQISGVFFILSMISLVLGVSIKYLSREQQSETGIQENLNLGTHHDNN